MENLTIKEEIRKFRWQFEGRQIPLGVGCAWIRTGGTEDDGTALMHRCYETGFRYFDTSNDYGDSEQALGNFIAGVDRKSIFVATKATYRPEIDYTFDRFREIFYNSFELLQTDYIDLYQVHDTEKYELNCPEVLPFLRERQKEGLIRYVGFGMRSITSHSLAVALHDIDSSLSYMDYNLIKLSAKPLIELCKKNGVAFINSSVLMFGVMKYKNFPEIFGDMCGAELAHMKAVYAMQCLCERLGVDVIAAAMQYSLLNPDIDMTLNGIKRFSNLESTISAMRECIAPEHWAEIFALQRENPILEIPDERNYRML